MLGSMKATWAAPVVLAMAATAHAEVGALPGAPPEPAPPPATQPLALAFAVGFTQGQTAAAQSLSGANVIGEVGYHFDGQTTLGLHVAFADVSGNTMPEFQTFKARALAFDVAAFASATAIDRLWASVYLGVHYDDLAIDGDATDSTSGWSMGIGLSGGVDLVKVDGMRLGLYAEITSSIATSIGYSGFSAGIEARR